MVRKAGRKSKATNGKKTGSKNKRSRKKSSAVNLDLTAAPAAEVSTRLTTPRVSAVAARASIRSQSVSSTDNTTDLTTEDRRLPNQQPEEDTMSVDVDYLSDDESSLHGPCGIKPVNTDIDKWECLIGKRIAKAFLPALGDIQELFIGEIVKYDQDSRQYTVKYISDGVTEHHNRESVGKLRETFEYWYNRVSRNGQRYTRKQATPMLKRAYSKHAMLVVAKTSNPQDLHDALEEDQRDDDAIGVIIYKMQVDGLKAELTKHALSDDGVKSELQQRLADFYNVELPTKEDVLRAKKKVKHGADWVSRIIAVETAPFTDHDFNHRSLEQRLAGFPDRMPTPVECHNFFVTPAMWELGLTEFNHYPKHIAAQQVRPPWIPSNQPWPPKWVEKPLKFTMSEYKRCFYI